MLRINRLLLKARKQTDGPVFVAVGMLDRTDEGKIKLTVDLWDGKRESARNHDDWRKEFIFDTHDEAVAKWEDMKRQYGTDKDHAPVLIIFYNDGREQVSE